MLCFFREYTGSGCELGKIILRWHCSHFSSGSFLMTVRTSDMSVALPGKKGESIRMYPSALGITYES